MLARPPPPPCCCCKGEANDTEMGRDESRPRLAVVALLLILLVGTRDWRWMPLPPLLGGLVAVLLPPSVVVMREKYQYGIDSCPNMYIDSIQYVPDGTGDDTAEPTTATGPSPPTPFVVLPAPVGEEAAPAAAAVEEV